MPVQSHRAVPSWPNHCRCRYRRQQVLNPARRLPCPNVIAFAAARRQARPAQTWREDGCCALLFSDSAETSKSIFGRQSEESRRVIGDVPIVPSFPTICGGDAKGD
eukprot:scaffold10376_cov131-Isochrysis_galbana.AAC.2